MGKKFTDLLISEITVNMWESYPSDFWNNCMHGKEAHRSDNSKNILTSYKTPRGVTESTTESSSTKIPNW